ncbi:diacylglycerol/polyprenol kinase family protein [Richelia sinica]|uniref:diacylglycerol/polyprenol kinase family protein n=1 Tax=Richelia sinica TaxID=1357545 RepID=UPI001687D58C|nr:diacylglycerol/polyprenol kinase family protein [Richelia sinica]MBD2665578.1 phosphatidate cytidylyltransferase [Richelia sinica FACHB-800]
MLNTLLSLQSILPLWLKIAIAFSWLVIVIFTAWLVSRFNQTNPELIRKIVHIGIGHIILIAWWLDIPGIVGIIASIVASIVTLLSYIFPILPGIDNVGRRSLGTFFYAVSIGVLVAWFWYSQQPEYAAIGIMIMSWGDGLAALIGQNFGKHKYQIFGSQKSWEGSLTVTIVSYIICSLILLASQGNIWQIWVVSSVVALLSTALEAVAFLGIDNLTVPIGSAGIAYFLIQFLTNANVTN